MPLRWTLESTSVDTFKELMRPQSQNPVLGARWQHLRSESQTENGVSVDKHVDAEVTAKSSRVAQHPHAGWAEPVRMTASTPIHQMQASISTS
jgi:hypothetical protein